jgi:hypothetical protein
MVATLVARNAKEAMVESGGVCGSLESGGRSCFGAFGSDVSSFAVNMFSRLIHFINFVLSMRFAKMMLQ